MIRIARPGEPPEPLTTRGQTLAQQHCADYESFPGE
jgi:hypothetical protein